MALKYEKISKGPYGIFTDYLISHLNMRMLVTINSLVLHYYLYVWYCFSGTGLDLWHMCIMPVLCSQSLHFDMWYKCREEESNELRMLSRSLTHSHAGVCVPHNMKCLHHMCGHLPAVYHTPSGGNHQH